MDEREAEPRAGKTEGLAAVRRAVVDVQSLGRAVLPEGAHEDGQEIDLALGRARLERDDVARGVVEQRVDAHADELPAHEEIARVADVRVPERARTLCQPAKTHLVASVAVAWRGAVEPLLGE